MTVQEAITILRTEHRGDSEKMEASKYFAALALERLTPQKPIEEADGFGTRSLCCPHCHSPVTNYWVPGTKPKHCQFCGQALDWGEGASENVQPFTGHIESVLRHIKYYLRDIIAEWNRRQDEPHFYENNIGVYNHVRKELDDLYAYAEKLGVNIDGEVKAE